METRPVWLSAPLVTAEEVVALVKVSSKALYWWATDDLLAAFREGRVVRFFGSFEIW